MPGFVRGAADGSVGVEGDFIILSVDFGLPFFLVDLKDLFEVDDSSVVGIKFRDEFAELEFFKMQFNSLQGSF